MTKFPGSYNVKQLHGYIGMARLAGSLAPPESAPIAFIRLYSGLFAFLWERFFLRECRAKDAKREAQECVRREVWATPKTINSVRKRAFRTQVITRHELTAEKP